MAIFTKKPEDETAPDYKVEAPSSNSGSTVTITVPSVIIQPRISEKAGHLAALNKYVFKVKNGTNKVEVKKAVENFYKVKVTRVNIVNNQGKDRNFGGRTGRTQAFKKAVVTLKKGDKIEGLTDVI